MYIHWYEEKNGTTEYRIPFRESLLVVYGHVVYWFLSISISNSGYLECYNICPGLVCFVCFTLSLTMIHFIIKWWRILIFYSLSFLWPFLNNCSQTRIPKASRFYFVSKIILGTGSYHWERATSPRFCFGGSRFSLYIHL